MSVRAKMQGFASDVASEIPKDWGFVIMCFPLNASPDCECEYISNANREDVAKMMTAFVNQNPIQEIGRN